jgi:predicted transposase/invertase (TIGR01784 family)
MEILKLTTDIVVKMVFVRSQDALRNMLSAVLGEPVKSLTVLDPHVPGSMSLEGSDKWIVLDVRVVLESGKRVIVEIQMRATDELPSRLVFYAARDLAGELQRGEEYGKLTPTVLIVWLGERMFPADPAHLHRVFELRERTSGELLSDQLAVHVLQLEDFSKLKAPESEGEGEKAIRRWARFFLAETAEELDQLGKEDEEMQSAVDTVKMLSQDPDAVKLAEQRLADTRLYHHALAVAEERGERLLLQKLIARKFGEMDAQAAARLSQASSAELEIWAERILDAKTLADVFGN